MCIREIAIKVPPAKALATPKIAGDYLNATHLIGITPNKRDSIKKAKMKAIYSDFMAIRFK